MTEKRFNCHVKFSAMPNGIMVLDYEKHGDEQTVIEDISREKAHRVMDRLNELNDENADLIKENEQLKSENKRLTDKLNKTALELVDECISQGKATEISEMSYREFLNYRAENGKPMELQL